MSDRIVMLDAVHGRDVLVDGRRVPMLEAYPKDGGKVLLVFDRRLGLELDASNYVHVTAFVADVMENVMHPECGRTFNPVIEITGVAIEDGS
jgi:hypothetical protein